jgi:PAS domain-containing protein
MSFATLLKLHQLSPLLPLIAGFCLIYIIQAHRLESKARNSMLVYLVAMSGWSLGALFLRNNQSIEMAVFSVRLMRAAGTIMAVAALHFVYDLLQLKRRRLVHYSYAVGFVMAVLSLTTGLMHPTVGSNALGYFGKGGPLIHFTDALFVFAFICSVSLLYKYRYSGDSILYAEIKIVLAAFALTIAGAVADLLPTVGIPFYPAAMFTNTGFVVLIAYGAFRHQLLGVLSRPQPRIVLASLTYGIIASGLALTFTESTSASIFAALLCLLFIAFNAYHFYDDIGYLIGKYVRIRQQPFLYKTVGDSSILFDDRGVGILAINPEKEIIFYNSKAADILGPDVILSKSLETIQNDILRSRLEMHARHRRETVISLDRDMCAELVPIELGEEYVGTLICFYPKSLESMQQQRRASRIAGLDLKNIFRRD